MQECLDRVSPENEFLKRKWPLSSEIIEQFRNFDKKGFESKPSLGYLACPKSASLKH